VPTAAPTQPPIVVVPASAQVPVGSTQSVHVMSALGQLTLAVSNQAVVDAAIDQTTQIVTLTGKMPGNAIVTVTDQRAISAQIPVRVAYNAGSIADAASIRITGDPASPDFVKQEATAAAGALVQVRPGAQAIVTTDVVQFTQPLQQDNIAIVDVPVLIQGDQYFTVQGTTHVRVENVDESFARARDFGARVIEEPQTWEYGERSGVVEDLAGHRWELTQTVRDVEPEEWGGVTVAPW